jgi:hypothetical protein
VKAMKYLSISLVIMLSMLGLNSCIHDNFEEPEVPDMPAGNVLTISDLRQIYNDSVISGIYPQGYKFSSDFSVYCTCTMDDKSGNIYKSAYIQDNTDAINLHLMSSGGLYEGDSIRLDLKGLILNDYENMLQLDSVEVDKHILKLTTRKFRSPEIVSISQIQTGQYQAKLIQLNAIQFEESALGQTWADADNLETVNHNIEDCEGQSIIVRTSGYADFANQIVPEGKGSLIAIVGQFRDEWQLFVRDMNEVDMTGYRCGTPLFEENFDGVTNDEVFDFQTWKNLAINGNILWSGINTTNLTAINLNPNDEEEQQNWLISPQIELPEIENALLSFQTRAANDRGGILRVFISSDYDGSDNPADFTWTELSANICDAPVSGFGDWTDSGNINLADYSGNIYIAFRYDGTSEMTTKFYLDSFLISFD